MESEIATVASCIILTTVYLVISEARRIHLRFYLKEDEKTSFTELQAIFPSTLGGPPTPGRVMSKDA